MENLSKAERDSHDDVLMDERTTFVYAFEWLSLLGGRAYFYMRPLNSSAEGLGGLLDGGFPMNAFPPGSESMVGKCGSAARQSIELLRSPHDDEAPGLVRVR